MRDGPGADKQGYPGDACLESQKLPAANEQRSSEIVKSIRSADDMEQAL